MSERYEVRFDLGSGVRVGTLVRMDGETYIVQVNKVTYRVLPTSVLQAYTIGPDGSRIG